MTWITIALVEIKKLISHFILQHSSVNGYCAKFNKKIIPQISDLDIFKMSKFKNPAD